MHHYRKSPYEMVPHDYAKQQIYNMCIPRVIEVPLNDGLGYVLSSDVFSSYNLPPFPASKKDGYAVVSTDGPGEYPVLSVLTAGNVSDMTVLPGTIMQISTGAPLPEGADAVVMVENTEVVEKDSEGKEVIIRINGRVETGHDVRAIGVDIRYWCMIIC